MLKLSRSVVSVQIFNFSLARLSCSSMDYIFNSSGILLRFFCDFDQTYIENENINLTEVIEYETLLAQFSRQFNKLANTFPRSGEDWIHKMKTDSRWFL